MLEALSLTMKFLLLFTLAIVPLRGDDWPEYRGRGRRGVWLEDGIVGRFPSSLTVKWRHPARAGYSGPAVAAGRVFLTDYAAGKERALALAEHTGKLLWQREWPADYKTIEYATGPRATPTVDQDRVYILGATGILQCLSAKTGSLIWKREAVADFHASLPTWGTASAPLVDGPRLIAVMGGSQGAKVVAFDKRTGRELWRALSAAHSETGYSQPVIFSAGGKRQLIIWHAAAVSALEPETGRLLWEHPFPIHMNTPIATPVQEGPHLLVSAFFNGARLLRLDEQGREVWRGNSSSEVKSDTLHALMASPVVDGDYIYGICSYGQLRCLKLSTGERVWETQAVTVERARNASAHIIRLKDGHLFFNDRGELVRADLSPQGYEEISRVKVLKPTSPSGGRRELGAVVWSHPAFANGHMVARNDEEVVRLSLRE